MANSLRIVVHDVSGHPFQVQLSRKLAMRGHEVLHLYFDSFQSPRGRVQRAAGDPPTFAIEGLKFDRPFAKYNLIRRRLDESRYGRLAARRIAAFRPDVVIASNTPIDAQRVIHAECGRLGIPIVFWLQDIYSVAMRTLLRRRAIPFAGRIADSYQRQESQLLRESAAVVPISPDFLPVLERWGVGRERCAVIENWAPLDEVTPVEQRNPWSEAQAFDGKFVFLYSGTIGMKHNPAMLVALADAFAEERDVRVVVISEGLGADWLKAHPRRNLKILPLQPFDELGNSLSTASVLVGLLGRESGEFSVPSKVLTYHCIGRPLLLAVPGANLAARIVEGNRTGLVVGPDDVEGFVAAARRLYEDARLRRECGGNAVRYALRKFDIDGIADRFEEILFGVAPHKVKEPHGVGLF